MKISSVSSSAVSNALRYSVMRSQTELTKALKESQTLQVADTGLALGSRTAVTVSFTRDMERMNGIIDSNSLVSARLKATQNSLSQVTAAAQTFLSALTTSSGSALGEVTQSAAAGMLDQLTSILNASFNGEHLFAGVNTDVKPIEDFAAGSPAKTTFDTAFQTYFGFPQSDPAAANISSTAMDTFLTTQVQPQFTGAGWQANWSNATDQAITSRITLTETTETSVSANNDGIKALFMTAATIKDLFSSASQVGAGAKQKMIDWAVTAVGEAIGKLGNLAATTGLAEKRVTDASSRLQTQADLFETQIGNLIKVDPYEAATRVTALRDQIDASYALTVRLQNLSLLKYLG